MTLEKQFSLLSSLRVSDLLQVLVVQLSHTGFYQSIQPIKLFLLTTLPWFLPELAFQLYT